MSYSKMLVQPIHTVVRKSRALSTIPLEKARQGWKEGEREEGLVKAQSSPDSLRRSPWAERCSPGPFCPRIPLGSLLLALYVLVKCPLGSGGSVPQGTGNR